MIRPEILLDSLAALPRESFSLLPTPLQPATRLAEALGMRRPLWVKRDDLTGPGLGGNKVRKLEYLLADAKAAGADTVITVGARQSNHARLTAVLGRIAGFHVELVLGGGEPDDLLGNLVLDDLAGARLHFVESWDWNDLADALTVFTKELVASGRRPYSIPMGGSTEIGAAGYARAYLELLDQLDREGVAADWVIHASSTGGTQAGLLAGRALAGRGPRIFGVDVAKGGPALQQTVAALANDTLRRLGATLSIPYSEVITSDFTGDAYGEVTAEGRLAIRIALQTEGLVLDPVYSAKALGAIPPLLEDGALEGTAALVFLHTGGQPALFASEYSRAMRTGTW